MEKEQYHIIQQEKCNIGDIFLREDKILMLKPFDTVSCFNLKDLEEMYDIFMDLTKGTPHLYYSDNSNVKSVGAKEKMYITETFHHFAKACAVKENSAIVRFLTHSFIYLHKPKIPIKMFKTEDDSILWLKSLDI